VIDTVAPNTPFLNLLNDTGLPGDNITSDNTPEVSMTSEDPNVQFAAALFTDNLKFRVFDRYDANPEFLLYDSIDDMDVDNVLFGGDGFTQLTLILETLGEQFVAQNAAGNFAVNSDGTLLDGLHNLKLEVEDRAGNISHDFLLDVVIDATPPKGMALEVFSANLDGAQQPVPVVTPAGGVAILRLSPAADQLEFTIELVGVDLDGNQTPGVASDDVLGLHIHRAPPGVNGPVVFGLIDPNNDENGDLIIDAAAGRISSV